MRTILVLAIGLTALTTLTGCAGWPGRRGDTAQIRLDRSTEAQAAAFDAYMRQAAGVGAAFGGPADIAQALNSAAAYEPRSLEAGMIAYAAAAALRSPGFVEGVRRASRGGGLARRLTSNPGAALDVPGGPSAARRASGALSRQAAPVTRTGAAVKQAAYSVQRQAWSRAAVPDPRGRLSRVKAAGAATPAGEASRLYASASSGGGSGGGASPVVTRGLAVAALTVLGQSGKARGLLREPRSETCLRMAKLNLHQCLASAGPHYEDIYCLGVHALSETGQCVETAARPTSRRAGG
jgi:hypothetical protein